MITIPHYLRKSFIENTKGVYTYVYASTVKSIIYAGQAGVAGYFPHCYPVPTKFRNCKSDGGAFFNDLYLDLMVKYEINKAIDLIPRNLPIIIFPKIGLGCAMMKEKAPKCYEYLMLELNKISTPYTINYKS